MQQRRVRLGDILDDYCPRERRITNHAVVAMIEDEVKQTRCTTCDADHEYKRAKVPAPRRKKPGVVAAVPTVEPVEPPVLVAAEVAIEPAVDQPAEEPALHSPEAIDVADQDPVGAATAVADDEWPVHRPLIRATLPRPEGQSPERKPTDFTIRQNGGRFEAQRNGNTSRSTRHARQAQGSGQSRFGNSRSGSGHGSRQGGGQTPGHQPRHGNRQGPAGQRGGRPGAGGSNRPGPGRGPKRGR